MNTSDPYRRKEPPVKPEIILPIIAAALLLLAGAVCLIRSWMVAKNRYVCSGCGYRFRVKWYKRPFVRLRGKDRALLTCPVCRNSDLFRREETT